MEKYRSGWKYTHALLPDKRAKKSKSDIKLFDKFPGDLGHKSYGNHHGLCMVSELVYFVDFFIYFQVNRP